jgi:crotonobetaine/carnitine-CoA ligase
MTTLKYACRLDEDSTLPRVVAERARLTPDARFVSVGAHILSFGAIAERAEQAASALHFMGVGRGDRVAVMLPNSLEFLELWLGAATLGAVLVPVNTGLRGDGLRYIVEHSGAQLLVADNRLVSECDAAVPRGRGPSARFVRGSAEGWESAREWLDGAYAPAPAADPAPADAASILYTSGTTGRPKGVINCHNAFVVAGSEFCRNYVRASADDIFYTSLPLFHVNAQMLSTCGALVAGLPLVVSERFSASRFLADLRHHRATVFNYIGAMLTMIHKQPEQPDDADNPVRLAIGGAAPAALWRSFERRFGLSILEIYGLTETACFCVGSPANAARVGKLGIPVSWAEVQIEREDGTPAPDGVPGEITIRSVRPNVLFQGYFREEAATAVAMNGGFFHSGDLGRRDRDGYLVFMDRLKDVIRRRGENISSYEVEHAVNAHPAVAESAAIGVPSELGEEEVMIVVVLKPGRQLDPQELIEHCQTRVADFMVPRYVRFARTLPKTATERVQKFLLRAEALNGDVFDRLRSRV